MSNIIVNVSAKGDLTAFSKTFDDPTAAAVLSLKLLKRTATRQDGNFTGSMFVIDKDAFEAMKKGVDAKDLPKAVEKAAIASLAVDNPPITTHRMDAATPVGTKAAIVMIDPANGKLLTASSNYSTDEAFKEAQKIGAQNSARGVKQANYFVIPEQSLAELQNIHKSYGPQAALNAVSAQNLGTVSVGQTVIFQKTPAGSTQYGMTSAKDEVGFFEGVSFTTDLASAKRAREKETEMAKAKQPQIEIKSESRQVKSAEEVEREYLARQQQAKSEPSALEQVGKGMMGVGAGVATLASDAGAGAVSLASDAGSAVVKGANGVVGFMGNIPKTFSGMFTGQSDAAPAAVVPPPAAPAAVAAEAVANKAEAYNEQEFNARVLAAAKKKPQ